jgi:hypothetical protein
MYGARRFMDEAPLMGHGVFQSLGQQAPVVVNPPPATVVPPVVVESPSMFGQIGTIAAIGAVGFLALEVTGITHVLGLKRLMK